MDYQITTAAFDDHPIILDAIGRTISEHADTFTFLFAASTKDDLLRHLEHAVPQVMVLDIVSDDIDALELFEYFREQHPQTATIAHSSLNSPALLQNLLFLGAKGFVSKKQSPDDLLRCMLLVSEGHVCLPDDYKYLASRYHNLKTSLLSEREVEIVKLISKEYSTAEIAGQLQLSINTVENHRKRIFLKLDVKNVAGMIMEATRLAYLK